MKEERLKELIEKEATIYAIIDKEIIMIDFSKKFETVTKYFCGIIFKEDEVEVNYKINNSNLIKNVSKNEGNIFVLELKQLFETKSEAEFYAEFGNVEKVIKMPVPPTWEEQSKIKGYGYFDIIKLGHLTLKRLLPISKIKGKFFVEKAYSKDFYTFEYTKQGYIKALRKMVELWREEV